MKLPTVSFMHTPLFDGLSQDEIEKMLPCLRPSIMHYSKDSIIFTHGAPIKKLALICSGRVHIVQEDYWGHETILTDITENEIFGESYACLPDTPFPFRAYAVEDTQIVFFQIDNLLHPCQSPCAFHIRIVTNLLTLLSRKNAFLTQKVEDVTRRTTREKLLSYLSRQARLHQSNTITIPFNRQQLADYLAVDRSAMTVELTKLKKEGLLSIDKNRFTLLSKKPVL